MIQPLSMLSLRRPRPYLPCCPAGTVDVKWSAFKDSISLAADECIPASAVKRRRPWISESTLQMVLARHDARKAGNWALEKKLRKQTQKSVRKDRALWLQQLAGNGDWESLRKLRSKRATSQTRLKDSSGEIVSSEARAEALADH